MWKTVVIFLVAGGVVMAGDETEFFARRDELMAGRHLPVEAVRFQSGVGRMLDNWGGVARLLYGVLSKKGFDRLAVASIDEDFALIESMKHRNEVFFDVCNASSDLGVVEIFQRVVVADGYLYVDQVERFRALFDSLSVEDAGAVQTQILDRFRSPPVGLAEPFPVDVARVLASEFPEEVAEMVEARCLKLSRGREREYEVVVVTRRSGGVASVIKTIRSIK